MGPARLAFRTDESRIHDDFTFPARITFDLVQADDPLAHLNKAPDYPVQGPAVNYFTGAFGAEPGDMIVIRRTVGQPVHPAFSNLNQMFDTVYADT